jgi:hypothetical protein
VEWFECFIKARDKAITKRNIQGAWRGAGIFPMNPSKVLEKLTSRQLQQPDTSIILTVVIACTEAETAEPCKPFDNMLMDNLAINAIALHSANTALNDLVRINQPLHTPARKFIPRLASTTEWLLAENVILRVKLQKSNDLLGVRKARGGGKRLVLKRKIVMSTEEILKLIEEAEAATAAKAIKSGNPLGRPRRNPVAVVPVVILEECKEDEASESDPDA